MRPSHVQDAPGGGELDAPLAVDLDGTLVTTDTLHEGLLRVLKRNPWHLFRLPLWLARGKAGFKREVAARASLDVTTLPYNSALLEYLAVERERRVVVLCTAADESTADAVSAHVGIFADCMATSGGVNLSAANKRRALVERFGAGGFDYAGNDVADECVFSAARRAIVVNPSARLRRRMGGITNLERTFPDPTGAGVAPYWRAIRPHQWIKNLLVYVPLLATLDPRNLRPVGEATVAFVAFCLVASSVYLMNDLFDLEADRRHIRKRHRPLANGAVSIRNATILMALLLVSGFVVAVGLGSPVFLLLLAGYWLGTTFYTLWLKNVPILDALVLSGLYTIRILGGAAAIAVLPSFWLLAFSMFLFLSLALAKRHSELIEIEGSGASGAIPGRGYRPEDLATVRAQGAASASSAVLVLALYIDSEAVRASYRHPEIIWLICPLLLYWINKVWLNSQRREINEDPIVWAVRNRVSRGIAVLSVALLLLARWLP